MESRRAILTYHSLDASGSVLSVSPEGFERQMRALSESGALVVRLRDLGSSPAPAVALTFDDGFENFAQVAAPALARFGFPATVFLVTEHCGGSNDWPGQWPGAPRLPLMSWSRIQELSRAGFDFGAHTATHPDLAGMPEAEAGEQILGSKRRIEDATGREVEAFAYPYGSMPESARRIVAQHFQTGCSTRLGFVTGASRLEALERIDVWYLARPYLFRRLFGTPARAYLAARRVLRELR